ncbi:MAG: hypothetical protein AABZ92_06305 [Verrucomicrobiota bacterium]
MQTALHNIQTYQELLPIAKNLQAGLSSWGCQYAIDRASMHRGTISIAAVAEKAMKIRQRMQQNVIKFTPEEKNAVTLLSKEVSRLYREDRANCEQADTLTTIYRFVMSTIFWINHRSKWPSYEKQLQQPLSIKLTTAIDKAQNYQELLAATEHLDAGLTWWGFQYAYDKRIPPSANQEAIYTGMIRIGSMAEKAIKIREKMKQNGIGFNTDEKKSVLLFCRKIFLIYEKDIDNCDQANRFTTVCRLVMKVVFWMNHQYKWGSLYEIARKEDLTTYPEELSTDLPGSVYERPVKLPKEEKFKYTQWE